MFQKKIYCVFILVFVFCNFLSCHVLQNSVNDKNSEILTQPEQIHLSYSNDASEMVVTWVTKNATLLSVVEYGLAASAGMPISQIGRVSTFVDGGLEKRIFYIHRVTLRNLKSGLSYKYHVGSMDGGWSEVFSFVAMRTDTSWQPVLALVGDMGNVNGRSIPALQQAAQKGLIDAVIHIGDFAYDMDTDNARFGDAFMQQAESFAAYVPYMTAIGNHEYQYNYSNYKNRFTMPGGDGEGMFYSVNIGRVHLVAFSSEFYYFLEYGWRQIKNQYEWLIKDLTKANKPENRARQPWIVTMCHRPMYCSNSNDGEHCIIVENMIRVGIPLTHQFGIEELLYRFNVDVHLQAHEHSYERMWPVYNLNVCNGSKEDAYHNPKATVHVLTGSGGCQEGVDPFVAFTTDWSAFRSDDYGFTLLTVHNNSHLSFKQISDNKGGAVVDEFVISKDKPQPYFDCKPRAQHFSLMHSEFLNNRILLK